jgi:hypothetical protein
MPKVGTGEYRSVSGAGIFSYAATGDLAALVPLPRNTASDRERVSLVGIFSAWMESHTNSECGC